MKHSLCCVMLGLVLVIATGVEAATDIRVNGLIKGRAVLTINGIQRVLKVGTVSPEGVRLLAADAKQAEVEVDGQRRILRLSRQVGGTYHKPAMAEVRIPSGRGGHYFTPGRINGRNVDFIVDTGATSVAMSLPAAKHLGIDAGAGKKIWVSTANGMVKGYTVMLDSVSVGNVKLHQVEAIITDGNYPSTILLGNSFLSRVDMDRDQGVLVLKARF